MDEHGIRQWNVTGYKRAFPREYYERALADGDLWALCGADGTLLAAACLFEEDRHWDDGVPALYAHNLASALDLKDAGRDFLRHAAALASSLGKEKLRLDSAEDNEPLARWYESQGYRAVGIVRDGPYRGTLREKSDLPGRPLPVNLLLFDGFEMLDAFGSLDFARAATKNRFLTASQRCAPVTSTLDDSGMPSALRLPLHPPAEPAR